VAVDKENRLPKKETAPQKARRLRAKQAGGAMPRWVTGDFQGSKTGPVGGIGTSLEIGGFGPGGAGNVGQPVSL
jgi:hypothetical protein